MSSRTSMCAWLAAAILASAAIAGAQPIPVPGTEMVPNEYGGTFPREITWEADGARMVLIPFGTFKRGLAEADGGQPSEAPVKEIMLPSFYIDKYEVSNEMYNEFLETKEGQGMSKARPSGQPALTEPKKPVCGVPWTAAVVYARTRGKALPTEAMWEKAARGPKNDRYVGGMATSPSLDDVLVGKGAMGVTVDTTTVNKDVSGYGAHHMTGNVAEWTADYFANDYYKTGPTDNPTGPASGEVRVVRGFGFDSFDKDLRLTLRNGVPPTAIRDGVGFRTVWMPSEPRESPTPSPTPEPTQPPPTRKEIVENLAKILEPYLAKDDQRIPDELVASRVYMSAGNEDVQFINFTPYRATVTFVGPDEGENGLVFKYNEPLPAMAYRNVPIPKARDLAMIVYSPDAPRKGPFFAGMVRAESRAILRIGTELFTPLVKSDGSAISETESMELPQYYSEFTPQWNEFEIMNTLPDPVVLQVLNTTRGTPNPETVGDYTVEPGQIMRFSFSPGRYKFQPNYIGATGSSGSPLEFRIDDKAARRLITLKADKTSTVTVITEKKPSVSMELVEAKRLGFKSESKGE